MARPCFNGGMETTPAPRFPTAPLSLVLVNGRPMLVTPDADYALRIFEALSEQVGAGHHDYHPNPADGHPRTLVALAAGYGETPDVELHRMDHDGHRGTRAVPRLDAWSAVAS